MLRIARLHGRNLTARAAPSSAQHRSTAVLGWLAAFVTAIALTGGLGLSTLTQQDQGVGESGRPATNEAAAGFFDRANVLTAARELLQASGASARMTSRT